MCKPYQSRVDKKNHRTKLRIIRRLQRIRSFNHLFNDRGFIPTIMTQYMRRKTR